jgi:TolB-like protein/tetratricopeptide (TPR) repeat protein
MGSSIHRLSAIVFTDIVGYTSMMGADEDAALRTLEKNKIIHRKYFEKYHSTYYKQIGDGFLAIFDSVVQAAHACGFILNACRAANINIRVGIHEGEVIFRDNDVYGDEVNIASRIESAAEGGSIYASENVKRNLDNKTGILVEFIKEFELNNVKDPLNLYSVKVDIEQIPEITSSSSHDSFKAKRNKYWLTIGSFIVIIGLLILLALNFNLIYDWIAGSNKQTEINLTEKSIAVLPFQNFTNDSAMNYLGDGFADHIIGQLSRIPEFRVIARASSFRFKKSDKSIPEIAEELGVQNILEGSIQVNNDHIHLNLNLIHAISGEILFSEDYNGSLGQLFDLQDEVTRNFTDSFKGTFLKFNESTKKEREIDLQAFKFYQLGQGLLKDNYISRTSLREIRNLHMQASQIDPAWSAPYVGMAESFFLELHFGFNKFPAVKDSIEFYVDKAMAINPEQGELYSILGTISFWEMDFNKAKNLYNKAIEINPNYPFTYYFMGYIMASTGDINNGILYLDKAISLDPLNEMFITIKPLLISMSGQYNKAETMLLGMLEKEPDKNTTLMILGIVYTHMKEYEKALETLLKRSVGHNTNWLVAFNYYKTGEKEKARKIMEYNLQLPEERATPNTMMAITYMGFEEYDIALDYMEKGLKSYDFWGLWLDQSWSDPLKEDPRYKKIMNAFYEKINK